MGVWLFFPLGHRPLLWRCRSGNRTAAGPDIESRPSRGSADCGTSISPHPAAVRDSNLFVLVTSTDVRACTGGGTSGTLESSERRVFGRPSPDAARIRKSLHMYPLGLLFGLVLPSSEVPAGMAAASGATTCRSSTSGCCPHSSGVMSLTTPPTGCDAEPRLATSAEYASSTTPELTLVSVLIAFASVAWSCSRSSGSVPLYPAASGPGGRSGTSDDGFAIIGSRVSCTLVTIYRGMATTTCRRPAAIRDRP